MPGTESLLILIVLAAAMLSFIAGKIRFDLTAMCVLAALLIFRLVDVDQAFAGFASSATATVAAMFVLSAGLVRTGSVNWLARKIDLWAGKAEARLVLILCLVIGGLSAFIVNTATVAIFIPVAVVLAGSRKIASSRVLIPLSYASQFGGVCTLIGTSTNLLVNSIAVSNGLEGFGLFEFAPLGLVMSAAGVLYLLTVGRWLLPKRKGEGQKTDKYRLADYLAELRIGNKSSLIGQVWEKSEAGKEKGVSLIKLVRNDRPTWKPARIRIKADDILLLHGHIDKLISIQEKYGLESQAEEFAGDKALSSGKVKLVEALVPPQSRFVGRTLRKADFHRRYRLTALAIQRRGRSIRERLADIHLTAGDTLLLQGEVDDVARLMSSSDLIVTNELTELYVRKDRVYFSVAILVGVVFLAALNIVPIVVAAVLGAVGMVLSGCLTLEEAYQSIDWQVIFLLGGIIPLGLAMTQTGTAGWIAEGLLGSIMKFGPPAVLAVLYLTTAVLTETMSNNAAAILLAPFAFSFARILNVDPRPFLVAITFAASTSFATPIGYQTNTMIYGVGGYRFSDYTKLGAPLNLIFLLIAMFLIPLLWPF